MSKSHPVALWDATHSELKARSYRERKPMSQLIAEAVGSITSDEITEASIKVLISGDDYRALERCALRNGVSMMLAIHNAIGLYINSMASNVND